MVALLTLALGVSIATAVWSERSLRHIDALPDYPDRPGTGRGVTWLLVGSDSRADLTEIQQADLATGGDLGSGRTDTILLVHLPALGSDTPTTMVSIPRDSYVPIPGYGTDKINTAFTVGGAPLLAQAVEQATGLRLDHYAEIGFGGFASLVDALGGITLCTTDPIDDLLAGIDLPAGCQSLNGRNALGYRPQPGYASGRPGPDGQSTDIHVGVAEPADKPGGMGQSMAVVLGAEGGGRRDGRRRR